MLQIPLRLSENGDPRLPDDYVVRIFDISDLNVCSASATEKRWSFTASEPRMLF